MEEEEKRVSRKLPSQAEKRREWRKKLRLAEEHSVTTWMGWKYQASSDWPRHPRMHGEKEKASSKRYQEVSNGRQIC